MTRAEALQRLGLPADASNAQARAAFRARAKRLHPDARGGAAPEDFQRVLEAWRAIERAPAAPRPSLRRPAPDGPVELAVTVSASAARLGAPVAVQTPAGRVRLPLPRGAESGQRLRLSGLGDIRPGGGRGDLILTVWVAPRPSLGDALRAFLRDFARPAGAN